MDRTMNTNEYLENVLSMLDAGYENIPVPVSGTSMCPFLHPGDTAYLNRAKPPFYAGDIVLYRRANGNFILHRIHRIGSNCTLWITGDNQTVLEPVNPESQVVGIVTSVKRKGRLVTGNSLLWQFYGTIWRWLRPLRPFLGTLYRRKKAR